MKEEEPPKVPEVAQDKAAQLKLYIYGSCESDQYFHPRGDSESKRPICLSDIENFNTGDGEQEEGNGQKLLRNPLFKAEIFKIACGALHTLVLTSEGAVYSFGCNDEGALGREGQENIPIRVEIDEPIHLFSAGDNHSVFANSVNGSVYFTGSYKYMRGQSISQQKVLLPIQKKLKDIDFKLKNKTIQKVVSGSNHSAILAGGKIYIRGEPETHAVGRRISERHKVENSLSFEGVGLSHVEDLWCGGYHSFAKVRKQNSWHYYVWGLNKHGQLGLRNYSQYGYPEEVKKFVGINIVDVAAGTNFTIVRTEDSEVFGCGINDYGQLGLGEYYTYEDSEAEEEEVVDLQPQVEEKEEERVERIQEKERKEEEEKIQKEKMEEKQVDSDLLKDMEKKMSLNDEANPEAKSIENPIQPEQINQQKLQNIEAPIVSEGGQRKVEEVEKKVMEQKEQLQIPEPEKMDVEEAQPKHPKLVEQNLYIKNFKQIDFEEKVSKISAGTDFTFAWNQTSLYSWGVGMNYVLLNGQEDDEFQPFKVKPRIINEHQIFDIQAGAQHVAYLSYPSGSQRPKPHLSGKALAKLQAVRQPLRKKKRE